MKVLKFGGTSVGSAAGIHNVKSIIEGQQGRKMVILSAMSGVTNQLVSLHEAFREGNSPQVLGIFAEIRERHFGLIEDLFRAGTDKEEVLLQTEENLHELRGVVTGAYNPDLEAVILTYGETLLTRIFSSYLFYEGTRNSLLDAREFMFVDNLENPDLERVGRLLQARLEPESDSPVFITQGFVCRDKQHKISTLKRGGSDYTATILAGALKAEEVQIWTDIDGFHNNDPRFVENTAALSHLTFEEAAELAYFGAKILHPQTVSPVKRRNIPLYLKNTFTPNAAGTLISSEINAPGLKAISAKDGITAIKIKSNRMLMAHGFLKKIFDVFDKQQTPIDMITTSEIAISLTIDDTRNLDTIVRDIEEYGDISIDKNLSIICVVGEGLIKDLKTSKLFEVLKEVPVRMISYGGSDNNVSLLVQTEYKIRTLQLLHQKLFTEGRLSVSA